MYGGPLENIEFKLYPKLRKRHAFLCFSWPTNICTCMVGSQDFTDKCSKSPHLKLELSKNVVHQK